MVFPAGIDYEVPVKNCLFLFHVSHVVVFMFVVLSGSERVAY